jgi:Hypothetical protein (DUF2513)
MQRDMNLVREILLWAVSQEHAGLDENPKFSEYTEEQIEFHVHIMWQAGLIDAIDITTNTSKSPAAMISSVTWIGYDFIDAAKNNSVWNKAKNI